MGNAVRSILTAGLLACLLSASARPAAAQTRAWPERLWFGVSGGVQPAVNSFSNTFDVPLYAETERVSIDYPVKGGALVAANGGYRVWKHLAIGLGVTSFVCGGTGCQRQHRRQKRVDRTRHRSSSWQARQDRRAAPICRIGHPRAKAV